MASPRFALDTEVPAEKSRAALALLLTGNYLDCESVDLFLLVTASAESRCRAALAAVRGAKG